MKLIEDIIKDDDKKYNELKNCMRCKHAEEEYKITEHYLIANGKFRPEAWIELRNFRDDFIMSHAIMKDDCKTSHQRNTKFCELYIKQLKEHVKYE